MCLKSYFKEIVLKLATNGQSENDEYKYSYLLEYCFFSSQLYSVLCENEEYKYSYLLEYWSKKPSTHEYYWVLFYFETVL